MTRSLPLSVTSFLLVFVIVSGCIQKTDVQFPTVTGPIEGPGNTFFSTIVDISEYDYIEEEFFVEGSARQYEIVGDSSAVLVEGRRPYKTRIVVRRPQKQDRFNGTVLIEWLNVTAGCDIDIDWIQAHEHILRAGYTWVGVSAQRVGIHGPSIGLKAWNPERYGSLDVTADSTVLNDELAFDIYSQAAGVIKRPGAIRPLGPLKPGLLIATGHSQSARYLAVCYNTIQPQEKIFDGFVIHGGGSRLRTDVDAKAFRINAETDLDVMS